jgi:predicted DNA-binding transcriptional regulator AlpA
MAKLKKKAALPKATDKPSPKTDKPSPLRRTFGTAHAVPPATVPLEQRLITFKELPSMGINYSITHLRRMWNAGQFPPPIYMSERRFAWRIDDLEGWIADRTTSKPEKAGA